MNNLRNTFGVIAILFLGGFGTLLSSKFGRDYSQVPAQTEIPLITKTEKVISETPDFSWQANILNGTNPNPTLTDWMFGATLCNTKTIEVEQTQTKYTSTTSTERLEGKLSDQASIGVAISSYTLPEPTTTLAQAKSCQLTTTHKVLKAVVAATPVASDENNDRSPDPSFMSINSLDKENIEIATIRQAKIAKAIETIKAKSDPRVSFEVGPPTESQLTVQQVQAVLNTEYPLYNSNATRGDIISTINLIDNGNLNQENLKRILAQHRGAKIQVTKLGQVQQIQSIPIPTGLAPLAFLAPPVRAASFSLTRMVFQTNVYIFNRLVTLTIFCLDSLAAILHYSFRLFKITMRKLRKYSIIKGEQFKEYRIFTAQQLRRAAFNLQHTVYNLGFSISDNWAKTAIVTSEKSIELYHWLRIASINTATLACTTSATIVEYSSEGAKWIMITSIVGLVTTIATISDTIEFIEKNGSILIKWINKSTTKSYQATIRTFEGIKDNSILLLASAIFTAFKITNRDTYNKGVQKVIIIENLGFHMIVLINFRQDPNSKLEFSSNDEIVSLSTDQILIQFITR